MTGMQFDPVDTLFFRDGRPFSARSAPQEDVGSLFPPHPATVAGAVRAALALCNGWSGRGRWPMELDRVLGNGPDDLGTLSLAGPFLLRGGRPLFRAPRHLLGSRPGEPVGAEEWEPRALVRPGCEVMCDLGDAVRLPRVPRTGVPQMDDDVHDLRVGSDCWLTASGLKAVLRGEVPPQTDIVPRQKLWHEERRTGLQRDRTTRTAAEGMLYSTRHVRLERGVSLGVQVAGVPGSWTRPFGRLVPLGGESRLAECREWGSGLVFDTPLDSIKTTRRVALVALTPLDIAEHATPGGTLTDFAGVRIVSACLDRPQRIGGWNSLERRPLPMRSVLPPGSTLFCEIPDPRRFEAAVAAAGLPHIGSRTKWGFGLVAPGVWPEAC